MDKFIGFITTHLIGEVFGNNLIRVTFERALYSDLKQSMDASKNEEDPVMEHSIVYQGKMKLRLFKVDGQTIIGTYNQKTFKPVFYMDATEAKKRLVEAVPKTFVDFGIVMSDEVLDIAE